MLVIAAVRGGHGAMVATAAISRPGAGHGEDNYCQVLASVGSWSPIISHPKDHGAFCQFYRF